MQTHPLPTTLKACKKLLRKVPVSLIVVALILSASLLVKWVREGGPGMLLGYLLR